ncbi:MAG TPA: hypothetical protein VMT03_00900 [Polyangia bacterium]|nr:hypothetical protein [Polyangia bacterium]
MSEHARHLFTWIIALLRRGGLWWGLAISVGAAVLSFAAVVAIVVSWPADRFKGEHDTHPGVKRHIVVHVLVLFVKNVSGAVLVILGLIMAVPGVPGQGLLTAVIGLSLLNFPGKRRLERRFVRIPVVFRGVNGLRARFRRRPLELD